MTQQIRFGNPDQCPVCPDHFQEVLVSLLLRLRHLIRPWKFPGHRKFENIRNPCSRRPSSSWFSSSAPPPIRSSNHWPKTKQTGLKNKNYKGPFWINVIQGQGRRFVSCACASARRSRSTSCCELTLNHAKKAHMKQAGILPFVHTFKQHVRQLRLTWWIDCLLVKKNIPTE